MTSPIGPNNPVGAVRQSAEELTKLEKEQKSVFRVFRSSKDKKDLQKRIDLQTEDLSNKANEAARLLQNK